MAVSLELARIFAQYKPKASIAFTAFAGEEQGLLGAENLAKTYKNESVNVAAMINLDMVGKYVFTVDSTVKGRYANLKLKPQS